MQCVEKLTKPLRAQYVGINPASQHAVRRSQPSKLSFQYVGIDQSCHMIGENILEVQEHCQILLRFQQENWSHVLTEGSLLREYRSFVTTLVAGALES
jgi:hypothetical protein